MFPTDALFIQVGGVQASAYGQLAIIALTASLTLIAGGFFLGRYLKLW